MPESLSKLAETVAVSEFDIEVTIILLKIALLKRMRTVCCESSIVIEGITNSPSM